MIGEIPQPEFELCAYAFASDRRDYVLDLTELIAGSLHFPPLMEDGDTFAKIDMVDDGIGVAWHHGRTFAEDVHGLFVVEKVIRSLAHRGRRGADAPSWAI
jgi:hypothetical protein